MRLGQEGHYVVVTDGGKDAPAGDGAELRTMTVDGALTAFRCDCGHLVRQEGSEVDGMVLWFHHDGLEGAVRGAEVCSCSTVPGCGGVVGAIRGA